MPSTAAPDRLGLALAGGGFRAALFHLGVLRRLAELDLLRNVEVISTVSGGSVVGAAYILRLKQWLERTALLTRDDYITIVDETDRLLCAGIDRNLRTRLLLNPLTVMRVLLTEHTLARAMARLYERHVLAPASAHALLLDDLRIHAHDTDMAGGIDAYNARQLASGGSAITRLVINATTLNSGGRFSFSAVEIGDWYLGHFRRDEIEALLERRRLLRDTSAGDLDAIVAGHDAGGVTKPANLKAVAGLVRWWRAREARARESHALEPDAPETLDASGWESLHEHVEAPGFPGVLAAASLGALRQAKTAAWYLRFGWEAQPQITGGRTREQHWRRICAVLGDIDADLARAVRTGLRADDDARARFLEFLVELYLVRTAARVSPKLADDWKELTVGDAVGASACFPPVFPPFTLLGIYDDGCVSRLGLTDGGVYDNTGIVALLDEGCTSIIASDTGGVFTEGVAAPRGHVAMTLRIPDILTRAVGSFQRFALRERRRVSRDIETVTAALPAGDDCTAARDALLQLHADRELRDLAYFSIDAPAPEPQHGPPALRLPLDGRRLSRIRTDLDAFGEIERAALVNHGYDTADRFVRRYMPARANAAWSEHAPMAPKPVVGGPRVERVLAAGSARFLRAVFVRAPVTLLALFTAAVLLVVAALRGASLHTLWAAVRGLALSAVAIVNAGAGLLPGPIAAVLRGVPTVIPDMVVPWLLRRSADPRTIIVLIGIAALVAVLPAIRRMFASVAPRALVRLRTAQKWAVSYAWNVTWLAWALPLLVAAAVSLLTAVSWLLFYLPWRAQARIRPSDSRPQRPARATGEPPLSGTAATAATTVAAVAAAVPSAPL